MCFKNIELLPFDSPAETDLVRRSPTSADDFVFVPAEDPSIFIYLFIKQRPKSQYREVGAQQSQEKRQEGRRRNRKEGKKWIGAEVVTFHPNPGD